MPISSNSLAAGVGSAVRNVQFQPSASNLPRKILVIGSIDPAKNATVAANVPQQVFSPEDAADKFSAGFMAHRLVKSAFTGGKGIECWVQPQHEAGGGAASTGNVLFSASGVQSGTLFLYIAGEAIPVAIPASATGENIVDAIVTAVTADATLPVIVAKDGTTAEQLNVTSKSQGAWGDSIVISFNEGVGQSFPTGVGATVTAMTGGSGLPSMSDSLDGLGTGDDSNENGFTDVAHGYSDSVSLDAIANYVGQGNDFIGLYSKTVSRPFRAYSGDTVAGSGGLSALITLGNGRKLDRANGVIAVPGSPNHPAEIASQVVGHMARVANSVVGQGYKGIILEGVVPGSTSDRWTSDYDNRDLAKKAGISTTGLKNGAVVIQDAVTFYHPDNVAVTSNGYREMVNIAKLQNILNSQKVLFEGEKYEGAIIVSDVAQVASVPDRQKSVDVNTVKDDLVALYRSWESLAWIAEADFSIAALNDPLSVVVRTGGDGFTITNKIVLSGLNNIMDVVTEFDTSFAVLS